MAISPRSKEYPPPKGAGGEGPGMHKNGPPSDKLKEAIKELDEADRKLKELQERERINREGPGHGRR